MGVDRAAAGVVRGRAHDVVHVPDHRAGLIIVSDEAARPTLGCNQAVWRRAVACHGGVDLLSVQEAQHRACRVQEYRDGTGHQCIVAECEA